jgi:hypothetical protein
MMGLTLSVGGEEVDSMEEFEEKAKEGFEAIGPVTDVKEDVDIHDQ